MLWYFIMDNSYESQTNFDKIHAWFDGRVQYYSNMMSNACNYKQILKQNAILKRTKLGAK